MQHVQTCFADLSTESNGTVAGEAIDSIHACTTIHTRDGQTIVYVYQSNFNLV